MERIPVTVHSSGPIPLFGGYGPFLKPVYMTDHEINVLRKLGYDIRNVNSTSELRKPKVEVKEVKEEAPEILPEDLAIAEEQLAEFQSSREEETVEEEVEVEEILVDDEELSAGAFYNEEFLTKAKAIKILTARGVEHDANDNAGPLKDLVLKSNPVVE